MYVSHRIAFDLFPYGGSAQKQNTGSLDFLLKEFILS